MCLRNPKAQFSCLSTLWPCNVLPSVDRNDARPCLVNNLFFIKYWFCVQLHCLCTVIIEWYMHSIWEDFRIPMHLILYIQFYAYDYIIYQFVFGNLQTDKYFGPPLRQFFFKLPLAKSMALSELLLFIKVVCFCDKHPKSLEEKRVSFLHTTLVKGNVNKVN